MLSSLPNSLRIKFFVELCEFVRWVLRQRGNDALLSDFEKNLAERENYLTEQVKAGNLSEAQADESRGNFIRDEALRATEDAALSIATWNCPEPSWNDPNKESFSTPIVSKAEFTNYKGQVERELVEAVS